MMNTSLLRLTWSVIEEAQSADLLTLTDTGLVRLLLQEISRRNLLTGEEICFLYAYIASKTTLIRDMVWFRFASQAPSLAGTDDTEGFRPLDNACDDSTVTHLKLFDVLECRS